MTSIKSTLARNFAVMILLLLAVFALLYLPALAPFRSDVAVKCNLTELGLSSAVILVLAGIYLLMGWRLNGILSVPLVDLVKRAESNLLNVSVGPKPKLMEANRLAFVIEAKATRVREIENLLDDSEHGVENAEKKVVELESKIAGLESASQESEKTIEDLRLQSWKLQELNKHLEKSVEEERQRKVGVEVEKRADEIYSQMERAVAASAMKSMWLPKILQEIKSPSSVIHSVVERLRNKWDDLSFSRIREDLLEVHRQSEKQMGAINKALQGQAPLAAPAEDKGFALKSFLEHLIEKSDEKVSVALNYSLENDFIMDRPQNSFEILCKDLIAKAVGRIAEGEVVLTAGHLDGKLFISAASNGSRDYDYPLNLGGLESVAELLSAGVSAEEGDSMSITIIFESADEGVGEPAIRAV